MFNATVRRAVARAGRPVAVPKRNLSLHEYRSAQILKDYGIAVPRGAASTTAEGAEKIAKDLGLEDMVIKAQVLAGGRGKGTFDSGLKGGVKLISSPYEAKMYAEQMLGHKLITKQTGAAGKEVTAVYVVEREFVRREAYLAVLMDRATQGPVIVASSQGGMDIEGVAKETPDAIHSFKVDIHEGVTDELALKVANSLGFSAKAVPEAAETVKKLYKVFKEKDATQIEINPLSETVENKVLAMDAKLGFDDNASFRQEEVWGWRDFTQEDPDEVEASKSNLNFIKLDGNIGCLVNGAGLAMATMDIIKLYGGDPANFLDCGGGATAKAIEKAFELITSESKVTAIFVNIFGGIVRCDNIAKGLIATTQNMSLNIPIVVRLQGTNLEEAQRLISESGLKIFSFTDLDEAAQKVCQLSKVVQMARDIDVNVSFELPL
ncbi:succinate--CoA ligase (GDP-forming) subunit beta [Sugiyamaella lignohabitans]|uniref:Succinate--CoA ligase [ADP-forming] subunit beta, mitochondrial n=1 Tax=Sugiyamaella lignohabitans TaxID=796027 RepID=A0A161HKS2_9ASCO|nr:succinate--CoA ligase (GDP-forming) subunit beta [Sugiyamaella lignohabitans]ANB12428.1 succinate--CoA ligase (GDP-forming) subunit beta [Sugiyamaella lignohabitans]